MIYNRIRRPQPGSIPPPATKYENSCLRAAVFVLSFPHSVQVHETLGIIVFSLSIFRIAWMRFAQPRLDIPMSTLMSISAKTIQAALYFLLLAVPLTAVFGIWFNGDALNLLGNTTITVPIGTMEKAGELLLDLHPVLADLLMWLAGVHAGAALFHHYILKDTVLKSMMSK